MTFAIPIRNIYFLLLYAWNRLPEGQVVDVSGCRGYGTRGPVLRAYCVVGRGI